MTRPVQWLCVGALLTLGSLGCGSGETLDNTYGRQSHMSASSVNGTAVLGRMFESAGHRVSSFRRMSPSLAEADVIVWVPDDYDAPREEAQDWLMDWLASKPNRTLIYVGRDFDAAPLYWEKTTPLAPLNMQPEFRIRESQAEAMSRRPQELSNDSWRRAFHYDVDAEPNAVDSLAGPWSEGVDAAKTEIHRHTRMVPAYNSEPLLTTGDGDPLVSEMPVYVQWGNGNSKIVLIENGSWLLNMPLVNHEHRKLAGRLVDAVGPPRKRVVFLESGEGGPLISEQDPSLDPPTGFALLGVWPIGILLTQLAVLGLAYAFARWPILGVPSSGERPSLTNFRKHITALGELLRETRDRKFAVATLSRYRQIAQGDTEHINIEPPKQIPAEPGTTSQPS